MISIHALLAESDSIPWTSCRRLSDFNPRSPCGERLLSSLGVTSGWYFNPRSPCGERRAAVNLHFRRGAISIHALLAESDLSHREELVEQPRFQSTLSLRRATADAFYSWPEWRFQSTLSLRRATGARSLERMPRQNFNPRSPCGERLNPQCSGGPGSHFNPRSPCGERRLDMIPLSGIVRISIHALLAESDLVMLMGGPP